LVWRLELCFYAAGGLFYVLLVIAITAAVLGFLRWDTTHVQLMPSMLLKININAVQPHLLQNRLFHYHLECRRENRLVISPKVKLASKHNPANILEKSLFQWYS
jgi:hypothetical protein